MSNGLVRGGGFFEAGIEFPSLDFDPIVQFLLFEITKVMENGGMG